jgi:hypothetical protein
MICRYTGEEENVEIASLPLVARNDNAVSREPEQRGAELIIPVKKE